jgi:hypothetical protein
MYEKCKWCFFNIDRCSWKDEFTTFTNVDERIANCEHFLHVKDMPLDSATDYMNFPTIKDIPIEVHALHENLWEKIKTYLRDNCELPDPKLYDVLTAWIFASWIPEVWNIYPYLYLYGISGTGKTRLLFTLKDISYKGIIAGNITSASLFRTISKELMTLFIDEYQPFIKGNAVLADINQILDCGYKKGGQVLRTVPVNKEFITQAFNVCGYKAIDSTEMIPDALLSRCIFIRMSKAFGFYSQEKDEDTITEIVIGLNAWREFVSLHMEYFNKKTFNAWIQRYLFEECNNENRLIELFYPLFRVAPLTKKPIIIDYLKEASDNFANSESVCFESQVFEAFLEAVDKHPKDNFVASKEITDCYNASKEFNEHVKSRTLADIIRSLGFSDKRKNVAYGFLIENARIENLKKRFRIAHDRVQYKPDPTFTIAIGDDKTKFRKIYKIPNSILKKYQGIQKLAFERDGIIILNPMVEQAIKDGIFEQYRIDTPQTTLKAEK